MRIEFITGSVESAAKDSALALLAFENVIWSDEARSVERHTGGAVSRALETNPFKGAPGEILELADNTADAVTSGCWQAAAALIERFATRMAHRLGGPATLVLGGGDAAVLLPLLSLPVQLSHDGVLRGLALWANAQVPAPSPG